MACPAGYTIKDLDLSSGQTQDQENDNSEKTLPMVTLYPPTAEPKILLDLMPEPIIGLLSGQPAIMMQWLKYGLARGSVEHSNFGERVLRRGIETGRYMTAAVYGTYEEKAAITSLVHKYHSRVRGKADEQGPDYMADDPELHRWTAATLFWAFSTVYEMVFKPMPREWHERLMQECSIFATSLRMPTEMWFTKLDDFWEYWNHNVATLEVTDWARRLMKQLLWPKVPLLLAPASAWINNYMRSFTIQMLPDRIREGYGLSKTPLKTRIYKLRKMHTRATARMTPKPLRQAMKPLMLMDMRRSAARIQKRGTW
ncbi:uncharacterized protein PV09_08856 [Verruconis gallopava]|uniref:ER-bound oxygenase mpaB/mpaB'/Rubber oxygenase catalytic domain-containing protein n=1 Tax=Verruconis gallopava TaxID=253628 RepID=A0A0D1ZZD2_9PEZI|nr:uncharacterized protein PV09_08856 [Verruconis gallopava]KIV99424.1 hypothetical protein PV09_08856 [Verruconis gallopava]